MKIRFSYNIEMKLWRALIKCQTTRSVQSDPNLHCPQILPVSSSVMKELNGAISLL